MIKIYENKLGVRLEVLETNKDVFGNKYLTWRWCDDGLSFNVPVESFKKMIKANGYKRINE